MEERNEKAPWRAAGAEAKGFLVLLAALTAFAPLSIDMYLPAFPAMAEDLGTSLGAIQRTLAVFFFGMAAGQLLYGPLADRLGRRRPLLMGLGIFTVASAGCALAGNVRMLEAGRLAQALGGCAGVVIARAVVRDCFETTRAARVFSHLMLVMGAAPILAPFLGGQMLGVTGWRGIFWFLAAFGGLCFLAVLFRLPETHSPGVTGTAGFRAVLGDRSFYPVALSSAFMQAVMFAYITGSPGIFIDRFGVPPEYYGVFFGANALALVGAAHANSRLLHRFAPSTIFPAALSVTAVLGVLAAVVGWNGLGALAGTAVALWFVMAGLGFVNPNALALTLAGQGARAGSASALLGSLQFAAAAVSGSAVSFLSAAGMDQLRATTLVMAGCAIAARVMAGLNR